MKKVLIFIFIFSSCNFTNQKEKIESSYLISENEMVDILYDMSLISVSKGINKRILENNGMKPKSYILKKYNIDSLQFIKSNEFYANDLEKYLNIYERVLEKLEFNREVIIDSIEEYKKNRANRSKQIISEEQKNNRLTKKPKKPFRSEILKN
jgi:predicted nucleic-acid-binding protein